MSESDDVGAPSLVTAPRSTDALRRARLSRARETRLDRPNHEFERAFERALTRMPAD
jgi:hypothetical protein